MAENDETEIASVGAQLRAAREAKGLSLEDIAAQTRIPRRHLESLEQSDWERLPAPTYSVGFAKSYASAVGLDRTEIGEQLRAEMGGHRPETGTPEVFEPADPARTMPKWLVFGAIGAILLLVLVMSWLGQRSLEDPDDSAPAAEVAANPAPPPAAPAAAQGPVVVTALLPVWLQIDEKGGASLFQGELAAGQSFTVPPTATAPVLRTGKPEALRITVGDTVAPPVGPAATTVRDVSLLGPDLLRPATATPAPAAAPAPTPRRTTARRQAAPVPAPAPAPVAETPPATTNEQ